MFYFTKDKLGLIVFVVVVVFTIKECYDVMADVSDLYI